MLADDNHSDNIDNIEGTNDLDSIHSDVNIDESTMCNISFPAKFDSFTFHNDDCIENNLLKLIVDIGAPDYAFKKILPWAKDAYNTGYKFNPRKTNYKSQIQSKEKHSNLQHLRPKTKRVMLPPDNLIMDVTCYDFSSMLSALLNDTDLNQISNLVVNPLDLFSKYVSPNGKLGEVNSGLWYQQAFNSMVKDISKDFLLPIIFAMDKTSISSSANLHVFAIMFTTTLFKQSFRNKAHAWQPLGYIPIDRIHYSAAQWGAMSSEHKSLCLNMMFDTVLQTF